MQVKYSPSPRQQRINYVNAMINIIGYYTGIFFHGLNVGYFVIDNKSIYYIDARTCEKINMSHKNNGWLNFSGNENQKELLKSFKEFIMKRIPVSIKVLTPALGNITTKNLNIIIREGIYFKILEGENDYNAH